MGAEAWHYFTPYRSDVLLSLQELRREEFAARRFYNSELPSASIEEAAANGEDAGTCSILDIENISEAPEFLCACPVPPAVLRAAFGSEDPDRLAIERGWDRSEAFEDYFGDIGRASACYVLIYDGGRASEVFFAGWSAD